MKSRQFWLVPAFGLVAVALATQSMKAQQAPQPQLQLKVQAQPQQQVQQVNAQQGDNAQQPAPAAQYRVKQLLGTRVSIDGNVAIGTVDDLVFDDNGQVEYLLIVNDGKLVTVPWEAAKFNFEQRTASVNITQEKFKTIPTYTVTQYPAFATPTYRTQVYQHYGLTAGQQRRLNRALR